MCKYIYVYKYVHDQGLKMNVNSAAILLDSFMGVT